MDDTQFGTRDPRGNFTPNEPIRYPPVFVWPPRPAKFLKWFFGYPGYLLPWNVLFAAIGLLLYFFATPPLATMRSFALGWIFFLLARNAVLVLVFFGAFHLRLYIQRHQGTSFKFNPKWPTTDSPSFLFRNQAIDNMIWTFCSAVPIWTAYEALTLWAFANHYIPFVEWTEHPVYFCVLMLVIPLIRELHFYLIHRLVHWPPLYRSVHRLHHKNVNPGPWSGLAMHPVEHLLYFSVVLVHWAIPSHPLHAIFTLTHTGLAPAPGHVGFDKVVVGEASVVNTNSFDHYLHHKYFECNYADGVVPLDQWFGSFHDGSAEAQARMEQRLKTRAANKRLRRE